MLILLQLPDFFAVYKLTLCNEVMSARIAE